MVFRSCINKTIISVSEIFLCEAASVAILKNKVEDIIGLCFRILLEVPFFFP